ncbi:bacteriorhodopsin-like [Euzebya tangerina]|uniref:bacteriorhodopsin-like n=1 Tax=Euzebya tangerina TaxID=591198 RepID=UPI00196AFC51|nr:bacteriorhodopsin-like [Euzebya tangerina]
MLEDVTLTVGQYELVLNLFSMTIAAFLGGFIYLLGMRSQVARRFQPALLVSAVVLAIAGYHYWRIYGSFQGAFAVSGDVAEPTGDSFNNAYRYVDWFLTVPLLVIETIAVLALAKAEKRSLLIKLVPAAALMIALGYPGEIAETTGPRLVWGTLSTIPFLYMLYVLWTEMGSALSRQSDAVRVKFRNLRLLLLGTWGVYPIAYLLPVFASEASASLLVGREVGYALADILAKALFGVLIAQIALVKTAELIEAGEVDLTDGESVRVTAP